MNNPRNKPQRLRERERERFHRKAYRQAFCLCKYSGTRLTSFSFCSYGYNCEGCEYEQALIDWKRGKPWEEK